MKNFEITHIQGTGTTLKGLTSISRKRNTDKPETFDVPRTWYTLEVTDDRMKGWTLEQVKAISVLLELAMDQMAIRSSVYLLEGATKASEVHSQLGDKVEEYSKDGKFEGYKGGVLKLHFTELYAEKKREKLTPERQAELGLAKMDDEAKMEFLKKMAASMGVTL